jgi:hypothetical protein
VRLDGGEPVLVRRNSSGLIVSSDGGTAYYSPSTDRQGEILRVSPIETGVAEPLVTIPQSRIPLWPHQYGLSPDDRWLVMPLIDHGTTNLWLVSTEDASLRQVTDFGREPTLIGRQVTWSGDSRHVFAAVMRIDADVVALEGALR